MVSIVPEPSPLPKLMILATLRREIKLPVRGIKAIPMA
jgi:hypothetical protein